MAQNIKDFMSSYQAFYKEAQTALQENNIEQALQSIEQCGALVKDADYYCLKATYFFQLGDLERTYQTLAEGVGLFPYHFGLLINMGLFFDNSNEPLKGLEYYALAMRVGGTEENRIGLKHFNELKSRLEKDSRIPVARLLKEVQRCNRILKENNGTLFPMDQNGESMIRKVIDVSGEQILVNMYENPIVTNVDASSRLYFGAELYKGGVVSGEKIIEVEGPSVIPYSPIERNSNVSFSINGNTYSFLPNDLAINQYHLIRINESGKLKIMTDCPVFVGNSIPLKDEPKKTRLVLKIFIDGLSGKFIQENGMENIMPNCYRYFQQGFHATQCFATSEWTLPSKATINTGKYPMHHKLLHPKIRYSLEKSHKFLPEYLKEEGYFTSYICSNWRTNPLYGYSKGFDRVVYHNAMGGMDCRKVVMQAVEHLEAFSEKNHYMAITLMDLHNVPDGIDNHLISQVHTDISQRMKARNKGVTSVQTKYDENKISKYREEIKRVDALLGVLFDFIHRKYTQEEVLVVLHSDHGQSFLEKEGMLVHDSRRIVPLMIKGNGVPNVITDELIETVDILPAILKLCDIPLPDGIDGRVPAALGGAKERDYAITHLIHPNQTYKAVVTDKRHDFHLETHEGVNNELLVPIGAFRTSLIDRETGLDVSESFPEKTSACEEIVLHQIKSIAKWNA